MERQITKDRIGRINEMLFEMAQGNFVYQLERSTEDDELESLTVLVNMLAQEMEASLLHLRYVNPRYNYRNLSQASFILDWDFKIIHFTPGVIKLIGFDPTFYYNKLLQDLLCKSSVVAWNEIITKLKQTNDSISVSLRFTSKSGLVLPVICSLSKLVESTNYIISFVIVQREEKQDYLPPEKEESIDGFENLSLTDVKMIQRVYDYILANIDLPLPTIQELSRLFNTNEFKLKHIFKLKFNTSIYKFYTTERLKKGHLLIQQTTIPLKSIAHITGFSTYPNFSRAFKKYYGYNPNDIARRK